MAQRAVGASRVLGSPFVLGLAIKPGRVSVSCSVVGTIKDRKSPVRFVSRCPSQAYPVGLYFVLLRFSGLGFFFF